MPTLDEVESFAHRAVAGLKDRPVVTRSREQGTGEDRVSFQLRSRQVVVQVKGPSFEVFVGGSARIYRDAATAVSDALRRVALADVVPPRKATKGKG